MMLINVKNGLNGKMFAIRTYLYFSVLMLSLPLVMVLFGVFLFLPPVFARWLGGIWNGFAIYTLYLICNVRVEVHGLENLSEGAVIYASKHQSILETFFLGSLIKRSAFTVKRELFRIPVFGWFLARSGMVAIDRRDGASAIKKMLVSARRVRDEKRPFLLFPEGTRRDVNAPPKYKNGVYILYNNLNIPVVPVAHNAGTVWPKNKVISCNKVVTFEFLPQIEVGLDKTEFMERMQSSIENKTNELVKLNT